MKGRHLRVFLLIIGALLAFSRVPLTMAEDMLIQINLNPSGSSSPVTLTAADGGIYFASDLHTSDGNHRLWKSNGTVAGTTVVSDELKLSLSLVWDGSEWTERKMHYSNGQLLFSGHTVDTGDELYRSDGTAVGTVLIKDINESLTPFGHAKSSQPHAFTEVNNVIYFAANDGKGASSGYGLMKTDGTGSGTVMVKDIAPTWLTGNRFFLLFSGGGELWQSIGSEIGTAMVKDIYPGNLSRPEDLITIGNTTYFTAESIVDYRGTGRELWKTDGTTAGTVMVADLNPDGSTDFGEFIGNNGILYFTINDGDQLWRSDGTAAGTRMIIETYSVGNSDIGNLAVLKNVLYFRAMNGVTWDLWKSDGTTAGTVQVTQPAVDGFGLVPIDIMTCNERLFFLGQSSAWGGGVELHESDGTNAGTHGVQDIRVGVESSNVQHMTCSENKLFFSADNGRNGRELWVYTMDECLAVGADLGIQVPCAEYNYNSYGFMLDFYSNPDDPSGYYWKLAEASLTTGTGSYCMPIATDLSMIMDCVSYNGTQYGFTLRFYRNPHASGLYWKMDMSTLEVK